MTVPVDQAGGPPEERNSARAAEQAEPDELVRLAELLQAALADNDVGLAKAAHHALGAQLELACDQPSDVVDLARERARRAPSRRTT